MNSSGWSCGDYAYEYKWTNAGGGTTTARIHDIDLVAPPGSDSSQGWVVRIMDGKKCMDVNGNYHPRGIFNENSSYYNHSVIHDVHIPINKPTSFPGVN
ncbi:polymorphic toxin type 30 domain-containing protein [Phytobacter palmae]|uniref:polymorphic toxin type 30 domain-containing protein n=1 Tax=Phytobacter palmae TaxID=1855371 RepID=UPI003CCDE07A